MACNASKLPFIRIISTRSYAAQCNPATTKGRTAVVSSTVLSNKMFISAIDNGAPLARITVAYKAGSRYEPADEPGLSHFLRAAAGNSTTNSTAYGIIRNLQQRGANLTATVDRETICYTLEASKDNLEKVVNFLNDVATKQVFHPWEFEETIDRIKYEAGGLAPQVRAMDLLHKAAFRRGLGNSLFCSPRRAGKISSESLQHFTCQNFTADRCAVGVAGMSLERATALAHSMELPTTGSGCVVPSPYKGGENRKELGGELAHIALAGQGAPLSNLKEALALTILAKGLGSGPKVKWGNDNSPLAKAIESQVGGATFAANAFSASYSDTGLFGVLLSVPKETAGGASNAAAQLLKRISSVGGDAIARGRNQLITEVLCKGESQYGMAEEIAVQGLLLGNAMQPTELAQIISKITDSDVTSAASKITRGTLSMGAVGNLVSLPYVDELK